VALALAVEFPKTSESLFIHSASYIRPEKPERKNRTLRIAIGRKNVINFYMLQSNLKNMAFLPFSLQKNPGESIFPRVFS